MSVTASEAVRGNEGIVFKIGATEFSQDVKAVNLNNEDRDDSDVTFTEAAAGDVTVTSVTVSAIQSTAAGSLWRYLWDNPGEEVAVTYAPHGNAVVEADKPHFLMTVKLGPRPPIGGEAKRAKDRYPFDATFEVLDGPTLDDAP